MAVTSGFYDSLNGDRKYNSLQFGSIFDGIIADGVFMQYEDHLQVITTGTTWSVIVKPGRAWFNHTWLLNDAQIAYTLSPSDPVRNQYRALVIDIDQSEPIRAGRIMWVNGALAANAVKPTMIHTDTHNQYPLCYVYIPAGATSMAQNNIENMIGTSQCPFVTGIIDTIDIDDLLLQWQAQWNQFLAGTNTDAQDLLNQIQVLLDDITGDTAWTLKSENIIFGTMIFVPNAADTGGNFEITPNTLSTKTNFLLTAYYSGRQPNDWDKATWAGPGARHRVYVRVRWDLVPGSTQTSQLLPISDAFNSFVPHNAFAAGGVVQQNTQFIFDVDGVYARLIAPQMAPANNFAQIDNTDEYYGYAMPVGVNLARTMNSSILSALTEAYEAQAAAGVADSKATTAQSAANTAQSAANTASIRATEANTNANNRMPISGGNFTGRVVAYGADDGVARVRNIQFQTASGGNLNSNWVLMREE